MTTSCIFVVYQDCFGGVSYVDVGTRATARSLVRYLQKHEQARPLYIITARVKP